MIRILLLTLSLLFTQELEVQGDLKVSGNIDAQNNPVKNVGVPQSLTDAINGNVLQDALRDDAIYEYKILKVAFPQDWTNLYSYFRVLDSDQSGSDVAGYLNQLAQDGWRVIHTTSTSSSYNIDGIGYSFIHYYTLCKKIEE